MDFSACKAVKRGLGFDRNNMPGSWRPPYFPGAQVSMMIISNHDIDLHYIYTYVINTTESYWHMSNHTLHRVALFTWETNAINHPQRTDFLWLLAVSTSEKPSGKKSQIFFLVKSLCLGEHTLWYCT